MKKYRNEWKYVCSNYNLDILEQKIQNVLFIDPNALENKKYYIHSLYFDDYKDICVRENESGYSKRFKWRIRYYNENPKLIFLEKKEKLYGRCHKKSYKLTPEEYVKIINKDLYDLIYMKGNKLLKEFCLDILNNHFTPKVIIDYERIAYIEPITNIRITLDKNISCSYDVNNFLNRNYIKFPLQEKNYQVLEVKFDYILPSYIKYLLNSYKFNQTSFSKYYLGRKKLSEVLR